MAVLTCIQKMSHHRNYTNFKVGVPPCFDYVDDGWAPSLQSAATKNVKTFVLSKYVT
jgi:hypothetical protein